MVMLPEVVAFCIRDALQTNLNLSWKIQHSNRGTTVVLYWRDRAEVGFQDQSLRQAVPAVASHNQGHAKRKKKSPSQIRRNQKRLADFKRRKSREGSTGLKDNPVKLDRENTDAHINKPTL
uniref:Uncharacterized protein n=1 Tax=Amphimedon queenslandica TaxID=400682 RepID=A0A1X7UDJ1_AMPQE